MGAIDVNKLNDDNKCMVSSDDDVGFQSLNGSQSYVMECVNIDKGEIYDSQSNIEIEDHIEYDIEEDPFAVPSNSEHQSHSVITHILSQVRVGMDLTKITLPTFILEKRSLLEMYSEFFAHPYLFINITKLPTPMERMLGALKFYLSSFHAGRCGSIAKKPYNPIIGEIFRCIFRMPDRLKTDTCDPDSPITWAQKGDVSFISEQVSHHPPISAIYAESEQHGVCFNCHLWTKSKFLGLSIGVHNIGNGVLYLLDHNEEYIFTFPNGYGRNIITVPWFEFGGTCKIYCPQTGIHCSIEFHTKPFYSGKRHRITGDVYEKDNKKPIYTIAGEWNGVMNIKYNGNNEYEEFFNTITEPTYRKYVRTLAQQLPNESRSIWKNVTDSLKNGDINNATKYKSIIEDKQREEAKLRKENNEQYYPHYFEATPNGGWIFKNTLFNRLKSDYSWNTDY